MYKYIRLELPKLCYHPGWRLMRTGYRTCFHNCMMKVKKKIYILHIHTHTLTHTHIYIYKLHTNIYIYIYINYIDIYECINYTYIVMRKYDTLILLPNCRGRKPATDYGSKWTIVVGRIMERKAVSPPTLTLY